MWVKKIQDMSQEKKEDIGKEKRGQWSRKKRISPKKNEDVGQEKRGNRSNKEEDIGQ